MSALAPNGRPLAEVYHAAAGLVRIGWCRGDYAQTLFNEGVYPDDDRAIRFCGMGAVFRAAGVEDDPGDEDFWTLSRPLVAYLKRRYGIDCPDDWNDAEGQTADRIAADLDRVASELERLEAALAADDAARSKGTLS